MESGNAMTQGRPVFSAKAKEGMRRRSPRLSIELEASLSGRSSRPVTVIDLSLSGCLVRCDALLEPGTVLDLSLRIDATPFAAKVQVAEACVDGASLTAQAPGFLAGLRFLGLPAAAEMRLRGFLEAERRRRRSAHSSAP
jgi:hypothetical protein